MDCSWVRCAFTLATGMSGAAATAGCPAGAAPAMDPPARRETVATTAVAVTRPGTESFMWGAPNSMGIPEVTGIPQRMGAWMMKLRLTHRQGRNPVRPVRIADPVAVMGSLHAELVPLRIRHHHPFTALLLHLPQHARPEPRQPLDLGRPLSIAGVHVEMEPVLDGLRLRHPLEQQPPAETRAAVLVVRVVGMPYGDQVPEGEARVVLDGGLARQRAELQQPLDERVVVLGHVVQRSRPEVGLGVRVAGVDDQFPVQGCGCGLRHGATYSRE